MNPIGCNGMKPWMTINVGKLKGTAASLDTRVLMIQKVPVPSCPSKGGITNGKVLHIS